MLKWLPLTEYASGNDVLREVKIVGTSLLPRRPKAWVIQITACVFLAVPSVALAQSDRVAVRAYVRAVYKYERVALSNVGEAKSDYEALALRFGSKCPGVIAGSGIAKKNDDKKLRMIRELEQIGALREEMYAALDGALLAPDRHASFALAAKLRALRWNTPKIRRDVLNFAKSLERRFEQHIPNPCRAMKRWAASGYRTLSATTTAFLRKYRPPRRLVIRNGSTPKIRRPPGTPLEREAEHFAGPLLLEIRALKRRLASALGSLVIVDTQLERKLGFPTLRK